MKQILWPKPPRANHIWTRHLRHFYTPTMGQHNFKNLVKIFFNWLENWHGSSHFLILPCKFVSQLRKHQTRCPGFILSLKENTLIIVHSLQGRGGDSVPSSWECIFLNFLLRWPGILVLIFSNEYPPEVLVVFWGHLPPRGWCYGPSKKFA